MSVGPPFSLPPFCVPGVSQAVSYLRVFAAKGLQMRREIIVTSWMSVVAGEHLVKPLANGVVIHRGDMEERKEMEKVLTTG